METQAQLAAVARMQDFIAKNLAQPITLKMLAAAAGYSPWHSARLFAEHTGKAPFEYIRALRLSEAARRLWDENGKIIDVAFDFVFDSHEGFTRAFSREFGVTPQAYRKNPTPIRLFLPAKVQDRHRVLEGGVLEMSDPTPVKTIFTQVVERPGRKLILKRGVNARRYYEYCQEVGCDIWGILTSIRGALYKPVGLWLPDRFRPAGTSRYAQGVEMPLDYSGPVPDGFELEELPPCKMMVFQGEAYDDSRFEAAILEVQQAIEKYNPELYGFRWADDESPRFQLAPMGYRGYIEARPVQSVK